jgi:hypothetical protein
MPCLDYERIQEDWCQARRLEELEYSRSYGTPNSKIVLDRRDRVTKKRVELANKSRVHIEKCDECKREGVEPLPAES